MSGDKYRTNVEPKLDYITQMAREGLIDKDIAYNLGVSESTFYAYKKKYPELLKALMEGKEVADARVENALYRRALGYSYDEITYEYGEETKRVTKHMVPDTTAAIFWLKNRRTDRWRDVKQIDHEGSLEITNPLTDLTESELRKLIKQGEDSG